MNTIKKIVYLLIFGLLLVIVAFDLWGAFTLGSLTPAQNPELQEDANKVVMVFGATGSVGDGSSMSTIEHCATSLSASVGLQKAAPGSRVMTSRSPVN